jgi:hypothetical protein
VSRQISASDSAELEAHLKVCDTCRKAQADFVEIESLWLSPVSEHAIHSYEIGSTLAQRILSKMQGAGARFSRSVLKEVGGRSPGFRILPLRSLSSLGYIAGPLAMIAVGAMLGIVIITHRQSPGAKKPSLTVLAPADASGAPPAVTQGSAVDAELIAARRSEEQLAQKVAAAEAERSRTVARLEEAERRVAAFENSRRQDASEIASLRSTADQAQAEAVDARTRLAKLMEVQASRDADFIAAEYRARS